MMDAPLPSLPPLPPLPSTTTAATTRAAVPSGTASQGAAPHTLVLATEVPVALVINGIAHAVLMATPADLGALALGFLLTEGIIDQASDCYDLQIEPLSAQCVGLPEGIDAVQVDLQIAARCMARLQSKRRSMSGRTGCGVCGVESFVGLDLDCPPVPAAPWLAQVDAPTVLAAMQALYHQQPLHHASQSVHAAAWADASGQVLHVMEDVGRHNALDKLIGHLAQTGQLNPREPQAAPGFVLLSSRGSHELVRKCARVGIAALATLSAPTAMGVRMAELTQLRLWGLCRGPSTTLFTPGGIPAQPIQPQASA